MVHYMGGKAQLAKQIVTAIRDDLGTYPGVNTWVEPFVGGGSVAATAADMLGYNLVLNDSNPLAAVLWMQDEYEPTLTNLTKNEYTAVRAVGGVDKFTALVAFGASFGGKMWGGFASNARGYDYFGAACRSWRKKYDKIHSVPVTVVTCGDYSEVNVPADAVVYCDPPYRDTTGYTTGDFDTAAFVLWCEAQTVPVYVSEFSAPSYWVPIWSKNRRMELQPAADDCKLVTDKVFRVRTR